MKYEMKVAGRERLAILLAVCAKTKHLRSVVLANIIINNSIWLLKLQKLKVLLIPILK